MLGLDLSLSNAQQTVSRGDFLQVLSVTGKLVAERAEEFFVPRTRNWQIQIKWMVEEGTEVKPGDVVIRLDTMTMSTQVEEKERDLENRREQALLKEADKIRRKADLELAIQHAEIALQKVEMDLSLPETVVSEYEFQKLQVEVTKLRSELERARYAKEKELAIMALDKTSQNLEIQRVEQELAQLKDELEALTLVAQTNGAFLYADHPWQGRKIQVGDTVGATSLVGTIPDISSLRVEAWVNETDILAVREGQHVSLFLDAYPQMSLNGSIVQVNKSAEKKERWGTAQYFSVFISLDTLDHEIMKPGMSLLCQITVKELSDVVLVPIERVIRHNNAFFMQQEDGPSVEITPLGVNYFYVALEDYDVLKVGDTRD